MTTANELKLICDQCQQPIEDNADGHSLYYFQWHRCGSSAHHFIVHAAGTCGAKMRERLARGPFTFQFVGSLGDYVAMAREFFGPEVDVAAAIEQERSERAALLATLDQEAK